MVDVDAVIQQFYPGELGGLAIAEIIFGAANPSGMTDDVVQRVLPYSSSIIRQENSLCRFQEASPLRLPFTTTLKAGDRSTLVLSTRMVPCCLDTR